MSLFAKTHVIAGQICKMRTIKLQGVPRQHFYTRVNGHEIEVAFVAKDSCGNPLGWYFTIWTRPSSYDSRSNQQYFQSAEESMTAALAHPSATA